MKRITKRSSIIAVTAAATLVVGGGVAFAYWTTSGSGDASAGVAADAGGSLTVDQSGAITGLYPGGPAQDVNVTVTNPTTTTIGFSDVLVTIEGTSDASCTVDNFAIADNPTYSGGTVNAGATSAAFAPKTVRMIETGANQDVCKGVTLDLSLAVS